MAYTICWQEHEIIDGYPGDLVDRWDRRDNKEQAIELINEILKKPMRNTCDILLFGHDTEIDVEEFLK